MCDVPTEASSAGLISNIVIDVMEDNKLIFCIMFSRMLFPSGSPSLRVTGTLPKIILIEELSRNISL